MGEESERVEALENKVAELEATVRGLTEELVDASERIRLLERELDPDRSPASSDGRTLEDLPGTGTEAGETDGGEDADDGAEAPKTPATEESDDGDPVEDDDIIVA